jgi:t-SNARE complex subunit (syntaxin)
MSKDNAPAYTPPWKTDSPYIPSAVSLLVSFSDSVTKVMDQINKMDIAAAWSNVHSSVESIAMAASGVMTTIETSRADLERMLDDFTETADSLKTTASELMRNPSLLLRERVPEPLDETE